MSSKASDCRAKDPSQCPYHGVYAAYDRAQLSYMMDPSDANLAATFAAREKIGSLENDTEQQEQSRKLAEEYENENSTVTILDTQTLRTVTAGWNVTGESTIILRRMQTAPVGVPVRINSHLVITKKSQHEGANRSMVLRFNGGGKKFTVPYTQNKGALFFIAPESITESSERKTKPVSVFGDSLAGLMGG